MEDQYGSDFITITDEDGLEPVCEIPPDEVLYGLLLLLLLRFLLAAPMS